MIRNKMDNMIILNILAIENTFSIKREKEHIFRKPLPSNLIYLLNSLYFNKYHLYCSYCSVGVIGYRGAIQQQIRMSITSSTIGKRTFKLVLLGDSSSGKTSIIQRFVNNRFEQKDNPTIGIDFLGKNVTHNSTTCRLQLWDTAGQERYRSLIPSYLKDAICAIFVFDLSRSQTLDSLSSWIELFQNNKGQRCVLAICGNKSDLTKEVNKKQLDQLLDTHKMKYYQTSAATGNNIQTMFFSLIDDIVLMQQARRKKISQEDDLNPPLTTDNIKSHRITERGNDTELDKNEENGVKLNSQGFNVRKFCCLN